MIVIDCVPLRRNSHVVIGEVPGHVIGWQGLIHLIWILKSIQEEVLATLGTYDAAISLSLISSHCLRY